MKSVLIKTVVNILIFVIITLIILAVIITSFEYVACYLYGESPNYRGEYAKLISTTFVGFLAIVALWLNYKRTKSIDKQTANQTNQIKELVKQNQISEKGQVNERFKNAIVHIGSDNSAIVLGGIYALHEIARDVKEFRKTVFEILCSYLREKTSKDKDWKEFTIQEQEDYEQPIVNQTIIDLLFKSTDLEEYIYDGLCAKLSRIKCFNADLTYAHLKGAELKYAHLDGSVFDNASLESANLFGASLESAKLNHAHLMNTNFYHTHLEDAVLRDAILCNANVFESYLSGADLCNAHLEGAYLDQSFLQGAQLNSAHLEGTYLNQTHFEGAILNGVFFEGAYLNETHFEGANLFMANFYGVYSEKLISGRFEEVMRIRIGNESEYSNALKGALNVTDADKIISEFSSKIKDETKVKFFEYTIRKATKRKTIIENNALTGILTKEDANKIIERYNDLLPLFKW